jgi:hypothetical protein
MGRLPLSFSTTIIGYLLSLLVVYLFFSAPALLQAYPPTAALGDALDGYYLWAGDNMMQGITSVAFFTTCWLARGAYRAVNRTATSPTPATLEGGTAPTARLYSNRPVIDAPAPPKPAAATRLLAIKFVMLFVHGGCLTYGLSKAGVVLLEKPLLENVHDTALYIVGGWKVIVGPALLFLFLLWISPSPRAAVAAAAAKAREAIGVLEEEKSAAKECKSNAEKA